MFYEAAYIASRVLGALFIASGLLVILASMYGMLAGAGGADVNAGLILWSFIGGKCVAVFGHILYTS